MHAFTCALLAGLLLFGLAGRQDPAPPAPKPPPPEDLPDTRPTIPPAIAAANRKLVAEMQGAWRLVEMRVAMEQTKGLSETHFAQVGYLLVSGNHLAIEMHVDVRSSNDRSAGHSISSGVHRFELGLDSHLETSTLIASGIDHKGRPVFEPPRTKRRYQTTLAANRMTLRRDDGHTLVFERLPEDPPRRDVFGRLKKEQEGEGKD